MSDQVQAALAAGKKVVSFPTDMGTLRDASIDWILAAHDHIASQPELIRNVSESIIMYHYIIPFAGMEKFQRFKL